MSGRPREFDETEVLDTAMDLFWEQGYEATGVAELSERCGIGRQSLYNAFGDKKALYMQALDRYSCERLGRLVEQLEGPGAPLDNVRALLDAWEANWEDPEFRGCLMVNSRAELGVRDPEIKVRLDRMLQKMEDAIYGALRRAQDLGELPPERDARALARTITITGQGLAVVGKVASSPTYARDVLATTRQLLE